ncbi:MAG: LuxR C-terminal-related transcriptional regulator [Egibacteraceae bacterium]
MTTRPIRLLVAESRALHRAALSAGLDAEDGLEVVAQASDDVEAVERAQRLEPDVVCVGAVVPGRAGLDLLCEQLKAERPDQRVLVIDDVANPAVLLAAIRAGVEGYTTKETPLATLVDAVRRVYAGEAVVPQAMLGGLLRALTASARQTDAAYERFRRLTAREKQVLELLAEGCGNRMIAEILVISPQTARTHIQNVVRKLGAHSRLEAAAMAVEHCWLRSPNNGGHRPSVVPDSAGMSRSPS